MVNYPILESHMHYWNVDRFTYPWHKFESVKLMRNCLIGDYSEATKGYDIRKILVVEPGCVPGELESELNWLAGLQEKESRICGIITRFEMDNAEKFSGEIVKSKEIPLIVGGRTVLQANSDPEFCCSEEFVKCAELLKDTGYTLEVGMNSAHLEPFGRFLEIIDGSLNVVIDHLGYPDYENGDIENWEKNFPNLQNSTMSR